MWPPLQFGMRTTCFITCCYTPSKIKHSWQKYRKAKLHRHSHFEQNKVANVTLNTRSLGDLLHINSSTGMLDSRSKGISGLGVTGGPLSSLLCSQTLGPAEQEHFVVSTKRAIVNGEVLLSCITMPSGNIYNCTWALIAWSHSQVHRLSCPAKSSSRESRPVSGASDVRLGSGFDYMKFSVQKKLPDADTRLFTWKSNNIHSAMSGRWVHMHTAFVSLIMTLLVLGYPVW